MIVVQRVNLAPPSSHESSAGERHRRAGSGWCRRTTEVGAPSSCQERVPGLSDGRGEGLRPGRGGTLQAQDAAFLTAFFAALRAGFAGGVFDMVRSPVMPSGAST